MSAHDPVPRPKRFYKTVGVAAVQTGFAITLDGRTPKTPGGRPLAVPNRTLAALVAEEWAAQDERIRPETMPVTRLVNVGLDRVPATRADLVAQIRAYAETDLTSHFAEAPEALVLRQREAWEPQRAWARAALGIALSDAVGVIAVSQPPDSLEAAARAADAFDDLSLAALSLAVATLGSAVLGLALAHGRLSAARALALSRIDETFQAERWGVDEEAAARAAAIGEDLIAAAQVLDALRD